MAEREPKPITPSADVLRRARKLEEAVSDQLPFVVAPAIHAKAWTGGDDDSDDYDRACGVTNLGGLKIGGGQGLAISVSSGSILHWPLPKGALLVAWVGAESNAGCIAAALAIPKSGWKKQRTKLVVAAGAEDFVMFSSYARGDSIVRKRGRTITGDDDAHPVAAFKLAAGSYAIDANWSHTAFVKIGKRTEETEVAAIRLLRT